MSSFLFILRHVASWGAFWIVLLIFYEGFFNRPPGWVFGALVWTTLIYRAIRAFSHTRRVKLIADRLDASTLASRHRRRVEIPLPADEAFALVEAAIRELPRVENVEATRDSLQVTAQLKRRNPYLHGPGGPRRMGGAEGARKNLVLATVTPGDTVSSLTLICEPEGGAWVDWFMVDDGTNLENAEAITRALSRRITEHRKGEQAAVHQTASEKELAVAKLNVLNAQVEPHFLYNTLASAQLLTRSDPARADQMLGNLITYLRNSIPRTEGEMSTLASELERARAYLEIMKIRMGDRLSVQVQVPEALRATPMPPMMLQTLVENAIKHGLEPITGGGTIWIIARESDGKVSVTVADNGRGFGGDSAGTGVGLKNVRERLKLAYGGEAALNLGPNFPNGVAASIVIPAHA